MSISGLRAMGCGFGYTPKGCLRRGVSVRAARLRCDERGEREGWPGRLRCEPLSRLAEEFPGHECPYDLKACCRRYSRTYASSPAPFFSCPRQLQDCAHNSYPHWSGRAGRRHAAQRGVHGCQRLIRPPCSTAQRWHTLGVRHSFGSGRSISILFRALLNSDGMPKAQPMEWTQYEVLLPKPSLSNRGKEIEAESSSGLMVRTILRSRAYERVVSVEAQDRKWTSMSTAKVRCATRPRPCRLRARAPRTRRDATPYACDTREALRRLEYMRVCGVARSPPPGRRPGCALTSTLPNVPFLPPPRLRPPRAHRFHGRPTRPWPRGNKSCRRVAPMPGATLCCRLRGGWRRPRQHPRPSPCRTPRALCPIWSGG